MPPPTSKLLYKANREGIAEAFTDPSMRKSVEVDFEVIRTMDQQIRMVELYLVNQARAHDAFAFHLLRSIPGVGKIGNVHLKWAFSEAAVLFIARNPDGKKLMTRGKPFDAKRFYAHA